MRILKKIALILGITLGVLALIMVGAYWYMMRPETLTPLVQEQASKFLTAQTNIEKVEPTFISSYPFFGIEIKDLVLKDNQKTIVYAKTFSAVVNVSDFVFDNKLTLTNFLLQDGYADVHIDENNQLNLASLVKQDPNKKTQKTPNPTTKSKLPDINVSNFRMVNFKANFEDKSSNTKAKLGGLDLSLELELENLDAEINTNMAIKSLSYSTLDSVETEARVEELSLRVKAKGNIEQALTADTRLTIGRVFYETKNKPLKALLHNLSLGLDLRGNQKKIKQAKLKLALPIEQLSVNNQRYAKQLTIHTEIPFSLDLVDTAVHFNSSYLTFNQQRLNFEGDIHLLPHRVLKTDVKLSTNTWYIDSLLALVPKVYQPKLKGIFLKGDVKLNTHIKGVLSDTLKPVVKLNLAYNNGVAKYKTYPKVKSFSTELSAKLDLNNKSTLHLKRFQAKVLRNQISLSAKVNDFMNDAQVDAKIKGDFVLKDFKNYIPKELKLDVSGKVTPNIHARLTLSDVKQKQYHKVFAKGTIATKDMAVNLKDSLDLQFQQALIGVDFPSHQKVSRDAKLGTISFNTPYLKLNQLPSTHLVTKDLNIDVSVHDLVKGYQMPMASLSLALGHLKADLDTISAEVSNTLANVVVNPIKKDTLTIFGVKADIDNDGLSVAIHDTLRLSLEQFSSKVDITHDKSQKNIIKQFDPTVKMDLRGAYFNLNQKLNGKIPSVSYQLWPDSIKIKNARVVLGDSDFNLYGSLYNLIPFIEKGDDLVGKLDFVSEYTDITELMDRFSGMGKPKDTTQIAKPKVAPPKEKEKKRPFMVPQGVDLELVTTIKRTNFNGNELTNIQGGLTIRNGYVTLEQMGFTSKAANMQLTGIYRSEREDHLYTFFDYHLLDIDIEELIKLIPQVEKMTPMLKSFKGKGEFHLSAKTNLYSDYTPKMSTLRAGAAFVGKDLVLLDGTTFSTIADKLMFEKETENKVDSLSVEMSVFKSDIDIFPFLIHMDDYQAIVEGRHQVDGEIDYHISIVESPLPIRLGLDITGTLKDMEFSVRDSKYKNLYKPEEQGLMEKQMMKMKRAMLKAHRKSVKPIKELDKGKLQ